MDCNECGHWLVKSFTYDQLEKKWDELIGGEITPGYRKKFTKESERLELPFEKTELLYKYCNQGGLSRFYIMQNLKDTKPKKKIDNCSLFSSSSAQSSAFPIPSPLWHICLTESHGQSKVKGQIFYPGLCENRCYFRIPAHNEIEPLIEHSGTCDICGKEFEKGLVVTEVTKFCCNKHYLQWWRDKHPDMFEELNLS